jgi:hypothetical protein
MTRRTLLSRIARLLALPLAAKVAGAPFAPDRFEQLERRNPEFVAAVVESAVSGPIRIGHVVAIGADGRLERWMGASTQGDPIGIWTKEGVWRHGLFASGPPGAAKTPADNASN